ncbi:MAG: hypothetical protein NC392_06425 [Roseburia sp.]|nr:hypothetical protein [Roseburia sp.]
MRSSNTNLINCNVEAGRRRYFFFQYFSLFAVLFFCIYQFGIYKIYGFSLYPDEFGYWANAADWLGYDWSGTASLGYYYSFGYSFILAPVLRVFPGGVAAYRAAIAVNMLLQCISAGLLWGILKRIYILPKKNAAEKESYSETDILEVRAVFAVGAAVFYPAWTFYTQMTIAESLLAFLYLLICYQFVLLFEKPKMILIISLSLSFLYLYYVHMRTIGVVIAGILVLLLFILYRLKNKKMLLAAVTLLFISAGAGMWMKNIVIDAVYSSADAAHLAANDYAGRLTSLKGMFTAGSLFQLLQSAVGKLYYLGMASFGLFYPALFLCIRRSFFFWKALLTKKSAGNKKEAEESSADKDWMYFFLLLSMLGQFLVSAIATSGGGGRQDALIYGRYNEFFLPLFIAIGVIRLFECRHLIREILFSAGISSVLFGITFLTALQNDSTIMYGCFAPGLNYLTKEIYAYQVVREYPKAFLFGIFLMALVMTCIGIARYIRRNTFIAGLFIVMTEILLTFCLNEKYTWYFNDINYYDLRISEHMGEYAEEPITYLYSGGNQYIDLIQFNLPDRTIEIYKELDDSGSPRNWEEIEIFLPGKGFLLVDNGSLYLADLEEKYERCMEGSSFVLFQIN